MKLNKHIQRCALGVALAVAGCSSDRQPAAQPVDNNLPAASQSANAAHAFAAPEASMPLHDDLQEISGLTALADGRLAAIQDEIGTLFILNPDTGEIEERVSFAGEGDYEAIELAGERLFVLMSNGTLLELSGWASGSAAVRRFETSLKSDNDTEGLAYDARGNRLLIITKEEPGEGMDNDLKAIYAFDLSTDALVPQPVATVDAKAIEDRVDKGKFKPSAFAVHPQTGDFYVVSSTARTVVSLGADGTLKELWDLPENTYEQPEGIAFMPDGDIYLASEGGDGPGMLHRIAASVAP